MTHREACRWSRSILGVSISLAYAAHAPVAYADAGDQAADGVRVAQSAQSAGTPVSPGAADPTAASNATTAPGSDRLDTVTITAQKRSERAQDVPTATTVLTERDIERAGLRNIQDAAALTPNLVIIDQLRPGIQTVSFRGFTTVQGGQSPFAIVVDGVPQPGQEFLKQQFVDVQQIEFLRGPQGTLYGAGAIAGAINIVTKPPSDALEARAGFGYYEGNEHRYTGSVSAPLSPGVAWYRIGVTHDDFAGLINNDYRNNKVDALHETTWNGQLLFKPTGRLSIDLRATGTDGTDNALWLVAVPNSDFDNFTKNPNTDITGQDKRTLQTYSAKVDYAFDPFTLTSITAYNSANQFLTADGDFSPARSAGQTWRNDTRAESQEFRLTSNAAGPLRYNLGLFFQRYRVHDVTQFGAVQPDGSVRYPAGGDNITNNTQYSSAAFGQASYDVTSAFSVTGGLRYDRVRASVDYPRTAVDDAHVFSELQPKVTLAYKFTPDVLSYATYSKGFRTGGFNPTTPLAIRLYDNETSKNYELGVKTSWLDNRLFLNGALFHTKFENQQFFFSLATSAGIYRAITNIPETTVNGAELELQYLPLPWLKVNAGTGYNKTKIDRFDQGQFDGNRTPQVYGFTANVGLEGQYAVAGGLAVARVDWQHRGDVYWDLANQVRTPLKNFINARLAYSREFGAYSAEIALVGRNLTDERTPAAVGANALGAGTSLRSANEPRQVGVEVAYRY